MKVHKYIILTKKAKLEDITYTQLFIIIPYPYDFQFIHSSKIQNISLTLLPFDIRTFSNFI